MFLCFPVVDCDSTNAGIATAQHVQIASFWYKKKSLSMTVLCINPSPICPKSSTFYFCPFKVQYLVVSHSAPITSKDSTHDYNMQNTHSQFSLSMIPFFKQHPLICGYLSFQLHSKPQAVGNLLSLFLSAFTDTEWLEEIDIKSKGGASPQILIKGIY